MKMIELHLNGNLLLLNLDNVIAVSTNFDKIDVPEITDYNFCDLYKIIINTASHSIAPIEFEDFSDFRSCIKAILLAYKENKSIVFYDCYYTKLDGCGCPTDIRYNVIVDENGDIHEVD